MWLGSKVTDKMGDNESYSNSEIDFMHNSKLGCSVESFLEGRCESYASKLALRASLRYTGEDDQWQTKRGTLRDRNKYVFNRELFSDVRFLVGRGEKTSIPAHRYVLAISSPVFSSLFYAFGALQTEIALREQIEVSECEPESFLEMLRHMYCDEVQLSIRTAPEVLFLARKYLIPSLVDICTEFISENLTLENTLSVLDHCFLLGVSKGLEKRCWEIVDQHAAEVANHDSFIEIDHGTLTSFLSRDTLVAREIQLFRAAVRWAGRECHRLSIPLTAENKRSALGDAFYAIRFPLMGIKEFTEEVAQSSFLSHEEVANMYVGYNSDFKSCNIRFKTQPRAEATQDTFFRCRRVKSTALRPKSKERPPEQSTVKFKVNRPISFKGVALLLRSAQLTPQSFTVELSDIDGSQLMSHREEIIKRDTICHDIVFPRAVTLRSEAVYSITVSSEDALEHDAEGLREKVTFGGTEFEFLEVNEEVIYTGEIPELLFQPLVDREQEKRALDSNIKTE
ncbi:BTB/POZ domain-containing protein 6-B-like isoform X1 [Montipora foliosa]|uniref:BTB/POZ domain-containing protein 6-B-like isoform X1 n=1 Tax=Montipora foliosa TaxID=591990 RepID=UPI0035F14960